MFGTQVRRWLRPAAAAIVASGAITASVLAAEGASAASTHTCTARALGIDSDRTFSVGQANPGAAPCANDSVTVASATAAVAPGAFGVGTLSATVTGLSSNTHNSAGHASADSTVANLVLHGPGLLVRITAIHSQANANCGDGSSTSGSSNVGTVVVNGNHFTVGSTPMTIPLGLGLLLNLNQQLPGDPLTQRAVSLTSKYNNFRHTVFAESIAGC